ncbi:MAG: 2-hydroxyacyl-CoA dehydratase [Candidatus Thorarchaeota archaeon]|nr:2-hydroxyacyl-CoA dehydratase [Candidatus Thorarchaeota archaeon]
MVIRMSYSRVVEQSDQAIRELTEAGEQILGYIYPHFPLEIAMAHGLLPSLVRTSPSAGGGYESSLQTFACSLTRNIFSQRASGHLTTFSGIVFSGNTCDSLQNVGEVWRKRFPDDKTFRLTYPAAIPSESSVTFLAEELRKFSVAIDSEFKMPFSEELFKDAVALISEIRESLQMLYAARVLSPKLLEYSTLSSLITGFLTAPTTSVLDNVLEIRSSTMEDLEMQVDRDLVSELQNAFLRKDLMDIGKFDESISIRLLLVGGMIETNALSEFLKSVPNFSEDMIILDLLSYGFKTAFTPSISLVGDPFENSARAILGSLGEPTQEGLSDRVRFLKEILSKLSINGLIICEQSFCDPDEFEAPSLARAAEDLQVPSVRLPIDPELSDRVRLEGRIQTFLETLM